MKAERKYRGKDSHMLSQIFNALSFFEIHLAEFTTFDPQFDAAYLTNWRAAQKNISKYYDMDRVEVHIEKLLLEDTGKSLTDCHAKYRDVKYFASKAFPDNKEALREFGEGTYRKVRNSHLRMVQFMETLHGVAMKYKTELIAQNYTQPAIDEIATLATALRDDNHAQQLKKKERPTETRKRIEAFNTFYGFGQKVSEAAKELFRNRPVERDEFRLGKRHHPKVSKSWFTVGGSGSYKTALTKLLKKFKVTLTNQSKQTVEYWQANGIRETPSQKRTITAGEVISITAEKPAKKFLMVQNSSSKPVRMMVRKEKKEEKI